VLLLLLFLLLAGRSDSVRFVEAPNEDETRRTNDDKTDGGD